MKVGFLTLGCDKNRVDAERMLYTLYSRGYTFTDDPDEMEAAVINTCCFIGDAKKESIRTILEFAERKRSGALKALLVTGCLAERYREEVLAEIPEADAILGTAATDKIADALDEALRGRRPSFFADINRRILLPTGEERILTTEGHYAYLRIAEGCDKHCTYCIIPSLRGRYRSVPEDNLIAEAKALSARGVKELILIAQETTLYGTDLYGEKRLPALLRRLAEEVPGIAWIRLMYCYPEEIDDALIDVIASENKVLPYLDMPVQSGSDAVLARMGRHTTGAEIRGLVKKLRERIPEICIRTTLIAGFPGETEEEHATSLSMVKELEFDRLGVFAYSREEGTAADKMKGHLRPHIKKRRVSELMSLQQEIVFRKGRQRAGQEVDVLIEGRLTGLPEEDAPVYIGRSYLDAPDVDGDVFVTGARNELYTGDLVRVRITGARDYDLVGEVTGK